MPKCDDLNKIPLSESFSVYHDLKSERNAGQGSPLANHAVILSVKVRFFNCLEKKFGGRFFFAKTAPCFIRKCFHLHFFN